LINKTDTEMLKIYKQIAKEAYEENQALQAELERTKDYDGLNELYWATSNDNKELRKQNQALKQALNDIKDVLNDAVRLWQRLRFRRSS